MFWGLMAMETNEKDIKISILILTHNAPKYVNETFETLYQVTEPDTLRNIETIVVDNASDNETKELLAGLKQKGYIDKLFFSERNTLFAEGNIIASKLADKGSMYYLLLNSDVSIRNKDWLKYLLALVERDNYAGGAFGYCYSRGKIINGHKFKYIHKPDGYCFLIERELFDKYQLDYEHYQWWWGITKFFGQVLREGKNLFAISHHNKMIVHYGGKSGNDWEGAKGMNVDMYTVYAWFDNTSGKVKHKIYDKRQYILESFIYFLRKIFYIIIPNEAVKEKVKRLLKYKR
jgi:GT2 family glycosyltransferase